MPAQHHLHGSVVQAIHLTKLFQRLVFQLEKFFKFHDYTLYNYSNPMSRKINPNLRWGTILKQMRKSVPKLTQGALAVKIGYSSEDGKSNVCDIENCKLPINEEKLRKWVHACGYNMSAFYVFAASQPAKDELKKLPS